MIPSVALLIAYLGDRLRKISRKAQIASAQLSTYLNEVLVFPTIGVFLLLVNLRENY